MATTAVNAINVKDDGIVGFDGTATFVSTPVNPYSVILGGASTSTLDEAAPGTAGVPLVSTGEATNPVFGTALVVGGGTGSTSFAINGVVISGTGGTSALTSLTLADGQVVIGKTGLPPVAATLTQGTGINIANGAGTITISATGGSFNWSETSGAFSAAASNGYFITNTATATLPASPSEGDTIAFVLDTTNVLTINAGTTSQVIRVGNQVSKTNTGSILSNFRGDSLMLTYESTGTAWYARNIIGTWSLTTS